MEAITSPPMLKDDTTPHAFFNPLLISMLGMVVTSTAIIAYHLLLVKYCIRRHASATTAAPQLCPAGVDEKTLGTIPIVAFTAVKRSTDQLEECVVCLGELEDEDMVRQLPNCMHAFHVACIDQWFAAHANCPICRSPILEQSDAEQSLDPNRTIDNSDLGGSDESSVIDIGHEPPLLPTERSCRLLRHCSSLVVAPPTPMERTAPPRLKRSLSMDHSFVVINLQRDNCSSDSSSSSSSASIPTSGGSSSAPSMSHFDRVSSKWLRSFSRLRMGKGNNGSILPY